MDGLLSVAEFRCARVPSPFPCSFYAWAVFGAAGDSPFFDPFYEVMHMLQVSHLTIRHARDLRPLLEDFSFTLNPGDRAVIIGEEGNGKSTLLKRIADPALVEGYVECSGEVSTGGARVGYLPQELPAVDRDLTVYEYFSALPCFFELTPREIADMLRALRLPADFCYGEQAVGTLSGGEKVKLQLCRLLMEGPQLLLLDEPSNDLDIETLQWLERFLLDSPVPVLYVSHDETLIERTANVIVHLELLRRRTLARWTVARMSYGQYRDERLRALTHQEQVARKEEAEYRQRMDKFLQIQSKVDHAQETITRADPAGGRLLKKKMHAVKSLGRRIERDYENRTQIPDVEEAILLRFPEDISLPEGRVVLDWGPETLRQGERILARDVRLSVRGPRKVVITGTNGAGKTTLLRRLHQVLEGQANLRVGWMPQEYGELLPAGQTPVDFLTRTGSKEEATRIRTRLGSLKYTPEEMDHRIGELSGGQKAKLLFLKMVLDGCDVLLLDEPTRNFSPLSGPEIRGILRSFGGAILSVSHDRKYIEEVCDTVYCLSEQGLSPVREGKTAR